MKKLTRFTAAAAALVLTAGLLAPAEAAGSQQQATLDYPGIKITLNGKTLDPKNAGGASVEPFAIDGTTYLPVRAVADALDLDVAWQQDTQTVLLTGGSTAAQSGYDLVEETFQRPCQIKNSLGETVLAGDISVYVELPASYREGSRSYPVCYVLDGNQISKEGDRFGLHKLYANNGADLPEVIFVGVTIPDGSYRSAVLAPPMTTTFFLENQRRGDVDTRLHGIGDYYYGWIATELKPYIDQTYRTDPAADKTGILGFSSGGSGALTCAMLNSDAFSRVGCVYPAFWMWENWFYGVIGNSGYPYQYTTEDGDTRSYTASVKNISNLFFYIGGKDDNEGTWNEGWSNDACKNVYQMLREYGAGYDAASYIWWDQGTHGPFSSELMSLCLKTLYSDLLPEA